MSETLINLNTGKNIVYIFCQPFDRVAPDTDLAGYPAK